MDIEKMASKWIPTLKIGSDDEKDPPTPRTSEQIQIMKDGKDIHEDAPRDSKECKDLQKDPPTSCSAETTIKQDVCSHPETWARVCVRCGVYLLEYCGAPPEFLELDISPTEDALWMWP